jgi:hypothetical protein
VLRRGLCLATIPLVLAACGSGPSVDPGGFTADQRDAAQAALDRLGRTGIPSSLVAISIQAGQAPSTCIVLPTAAADRFQLVIAWKPDRGAYKNVAQSVLQATIPRSASGIVSHVTSFGGGGTNPRPEPPAVAAAVVRASLAKPAERCEVLENGHLRLVEAT